MKKWTHNFGQVSGQIYQICLFLMKIESRRLFSLLQRPEFFSFFHSVQCEKKREKNASNRFHSNLLLGVHIHRYFFLCTHLGRLNTFKLLLYLVLKIVVHVLVKGSSFWFSVLFYLLGIWSSSSIPKSKVNIPILLS